MNSVFVPPLASIEAAWQDLSEDILCTPCWHWRGDFVDTHFGSKGRVQLKLELLQYTGSFKVRGALLSLKQLTPDQLRHGVTAVSAGNHAAAVAFAAQKLGSSAKVVMPSYANPARISLCQSLGAEVVFAEDVHRAFDKVKQIERDESRCFIHPFEGEAISLGTASLGYEFWRQSGELDALIVPIGGGGLCAGIAAAVKQLMPACAVYGVEPKGANSMSLSFAAGEPQAIENVNTIADSLGAPHAAPYSFGLCRRFVDEIVLVDDDALCAAMYHLFTQMKLAVEPAGAASTAALLGPLRKRLYNKRVGLIVCGANIDHENFCRYLHRGAEWVGADKNSVESVG